MTPLGKPRPKVTADSDPFKGHDMGEAQMMCRRCSAPGWKIKLEKLRCISDARMAGNAAIGRITSRR